MPSVEQPRGWATQSARMIAGLQPTFYELCGLMYNIDLEHAMLLDLPLLEKGGQADHLIKRERAIAPF